MEITEKYADQLLERNDLTWEGGNPIEKQDLIDNFVIEGNTLVHPDDYRIENILFTPYWVEIVQDDDRECPREWSNLGTIAYKHRKYVLGEEEIDDPIEWLESMLNLENAGEYTNQRLQELEAEFYQKYIALPLYLYDHSGHSISTKPFGCRWDSGKVGYIYTTPERLKEMKLTSLTKEEILGYLEGEVETFNQYIQGDVYGLRLYKGEEEVDSCWGFYGTDWETNGIKECIEQEVWPLLEDVQISY